MFTSFSEFKFYQSFRVPVEANDDVRYSLEYEDEDGKMVFIDDVLLTDISVTGIGFKSAERLKVGSYLRFSFNFKRLRFDLGSSVVRAFSNNLEDSMMNYGAEVDGEDGVKMKRFLDQYINSFSQDRLKECLLNLALSERYSTAKEGFEMFSLLLSLFKDITQFGNMEGFAESMLEEITRIINAQRASIFLINPETNELEAVAALGIDKDVLKFDYRKGIAGSVFTTGVALNIDTETDEVRFSEQIDKKTGFQTRSIICHPITNREDKVIGVIEVLNKRNQARFTGDDEKTMKVLSLICSSVFHNYNPMSERSLIRRFSTPRDRMHALIGTTTFVNELRKAIVKIKDLETPLLIEGEPGTGKSLLGRIVHQEGKRGINKWIEINCQGVSPSVIEKQIFGGPNEPSVLEECIGGTVLFKHIDHMPINLQEQLVKHLKHRRLPNSSISLDVRCIFTTTENLDKLTKETNSFNSELYEYLSVSNVIVQPLRRRIEDIEALVSYFMKKECKRQGLLLKNLSDKAIEQLQNYDWPGNITELERAISKIVLYNPKAHIISKIDDTVTPIIDKTKQPLGSFNHIPYVTDFNVPLKDRLCLVEREMIMAEIKRCNGNKSKAAKAMGISREALRKKLLQSDVVLDESESTEVKKVA